MKQELEDIGRIWFRGALDENSLNAFESFTESKISIGQRPSLQNFDPTAFSPITYLAQTLLEKARHVRCVTFNKSQDANWALPWHQDRVIAVDCKAPQKGYKNWTQKSSIWHCEPPVAVLQNMIFARIHLNDSNPENGCLELSLGSHKHGTVLANNIADIVSELPKEVCVAKRGDVLFVKALTLHRSQTSKTKRPRNALRVDYANFALPKDLDWAFDDVSQG